MVAPLQGRAHYPAATQLYKQDDRETGQLLMNLAAYIWSMGNVTYNNVSYAVKAIGTLEAHGYSITCSLS